MKILLEGWDLPRNQDLGGVQSYWRQLVPALLAEAGPREDFVLLSAFLNPRRVGALQAYRNAGATLRHWWASPGWIRALGRRGFRAEWFAGAHDLAHAPEATWTLRTSGRLVVTCHDLMFVHHPQYLAPSTVARLVEGMERGVREAAFWICNSAFTRDDLVATYGVAPGRTAVVHHGVDEAFRAAGDARAERGGDDTGRFLFLGSVEPKKNLEVLLRALALAAERGLRGGLDIAGRASWQSEAIRRLPERHPVLADRVNFLGFVPDAALPALVASARALVLPSRFEGFGMPVIEAMAAGTPVLCSDRGALPEVAGGAAALFDADDAEGLAELLVQLEQDAERRAAMRRSGRERATGFSWPRCARETLAAYRRAMELPA